jgi:hypothetical protein
MKVSIKIFNPQKTINRILDDDVGTFMAETCGRYFNKFVPMQTGMLSQTYETKPFELIYNQPYARKMYYGDGFNFSKEKHPLATSRWDKASFEVNKRKIASEVTKYINR